MCELHFVLDMIACRSVVRLKKLNTVGFSSYNISSLAETASMLICIAFFLLRKKYTGV